VARGGNPPLSQPAVQKKSDGELRSSKTRVVGTNDHLDDTTGNTQKHRKNLTKNIKLATLY
jgi:hypothetical protein